MARSFFGPLIMSAALATTAAASAEAQIRSENYATASPSDAQQLKQIREQLLWQEKDTPQAQERRAAIYDKLEQKYEGRRPDIDRQLAEASGLDREYMQIVQRDNERIIAGLSDLREAVRWDAAHPGDGHELTALQNIRNTFDETKGHLPQYLPNFKADGASGLPAQTQSGATTGAPAGHRRTLAELATMTVASGHVPPPQNQGRQPGSPPPSAEEIRAMNARATNVYAEAADPTQPGATNPYSLSNYTFYAMTHVPDKKHLENPGSGRDLATKNVITVVPGSVSWLDRSDPAHPVSRGQDMPLIVQSTQTPLNIKPFDNAEATRATVFFNMKTRSVDIHLYTNHNEIMTAQADMVPGPKGPLIHITYINDNQNEYHLNIARDGIRSQRDQNLFTTFDNIAHEALVVAVNANKYNLAIDKNAGYPTDFRSAVVEPESQAIHMQMGDWRFMMTPPGNLTGSNARTGDTVTANSPDFYTATFNLGLDGRRPTARVAHMGNVTVTHDGQTSNYNFTPGSDQLTTTYSPGRSETYNAIREFPMEILPQLKVIQSAIDYAAPVANNHGFNQWFPQIRGGSQPAKGEPGSPDNPLPDFAKPPQKGQKATSGPASDKTGSGPVPDSDIPTAYKGSGTVTETPLPPPPPSRYPSAGGMSPGR